MDRSPCIVLHPCCHHAAVLSCLLSVSLYQVSFALPEEQRRWINPSLGVEFISTGPAGSAPFDAARRQCTAEEEVEDGGGGGGGGQQCGGGGGGGGSSTRPGGGPRGMPEGDGAEGGHGVDAFVQRFRLVYGHYQRPMFHTLLNAYSNDRPDLLVVDRHTFAGYDVAHSLNLSYMVNNAMLLLDLDDPPGYIPAPYRWGRGAGATTHHTMVHDY